MNGMRKFTITVMYLLVASFVAIKLGESGTDGTGISLVCVGLSTGVGAFMYGNVKTHQTQAQEIIRGRK